MSKAFFHEAAVVNTERECLIRWEEVHKSFGANHVLRGVTLHVCRGETLVIIGRSGCGKSVLLKTLVGLISPDSGKIWVKDRQIVGDPPAMAEAQRLCGMVFQGAALFDSLSVAENLALPYWENTDLSREEIEERIRSLLALVGLRDVEQLMPAELSGGMRKRVSLARALADEPEIILYDEPTTGLDPIMADAINELIRSTQEKVKLTSIVVTHDLSTVRKVANNVAMLHEGRIVFHGPPDELFGSADPVATQFIQGRADARVEVPRPELREHEIDE
ncbi:MAG TPA: ABC transporter ATP-binding protein [Candidatus Latescibacteria bacterium]|nr:ABC transporter ATP-binding protein [Candidatus Latescibacterota bacterium]